MAARHSPADEPSADRVTPRAHPGFNAQVTDAMLVREVLGGDRRAFTTLVERFSPACMRLAMRMLLNRQDAEDATQETFVRAYRALHRYRDTDTFHTWLFQILVNRCRSMLARERRWAMLVVPDDRALEQAVAPRQQTGELRDELGRALASLPTEQREAFLLKHVEMLSYKEMAVVTGARIPALKMRVKRACERLQSLLEEVVDA